MKYRLTVDLLSPVGPITGTVEVDQLPLNSPDTRADISRFLDGIDPKAIEAKVLSGGYVTGPVEATIEALKEVAGGRS